MFSRAKAGGVCTARIFLASNDLRSIVEVRRARLALLLQRRIRLDVSGFFEKCGFTIS